MLPEWLQHLIVCLHQSNKPWQPKGDPVPCYWAATFFVCDCPGCKRLARCGFTKTHSSSQQWGRPCLEQEYVASPGETAPRKVWCMYPKLPSRSDMAFLRESPKMVVMSFWCSFNTTKKERGTSSKEDEPPISGSATTATTHLYWHESKLECPTELCRSGIQTRNRSPLLVEENSQFGGVGKAWAPHSIFL